MLSQILGALINSIVSVTTSVFKGVKAVRFYFVAVLIFLTAIGYMYKDTLNMATQVALFNQVKFRECRDLLGLQDSFTSILKKDTIVDRYAVYLYQPINSSFYKKVVITNSDYVLHAPSLQGMYLKDQPTINSELSQHDYYLINEREALTHPDLKYLADISNKECMFYALKVDGKMVGEIVIRFKDTPSIPQVELLLRHLSPLLFNYII